MKISWGTVVIPEDIPEGREARETPSQPAPRGPGGGAIGGP